MITVYDRDGKSLKVHSVDARELLQQGEHFDYDPTKEKPVGSASGMSMFEDDADIYEMSKADLIAFALEKFSAKLSNRFGEARLRGEIEKLKQLEEQEQEEQDLLDEDEDI